MTQRASAARVLLAVAMCVLAACGAGAKFKVGEAVEYEYAGGTYTGKVIAVEQKNGKTWYQVRHDDSRYQPSWQEEWRIHPNDPKEKAKTSWNLSVEDTFGTWTLGTVTRTTSETATHVTTTTSGHVVGGTLAVRPDGTYLWKASAAETYSGKWEREPNPQQYRGPVILRNAWKGRDWWLMYSGYTGGIPQLYLAANDGIRFFGSKAN